MKTLPGETLFLFRYLFMKWRRKIHDMSAPLEQQQQAIAPAIETPQNTGEAKTLSEEQRKAGSGGESEES